MIAIIIAACDGLLQEIFCFFTAPMGLKEKCLVEQCVSICQKENQMVRDHRLEPQYQSPSQVDATPAEIPEQTGHLFRSGFRGGAEPLLRVGENLPHRQALWRDTLLPSSSKS